MSFTQKKVNASFTLARGNLQGGGNTLSLKGLRTSTRISAVPGTAGSFLDNLEIYGMTLSQMNQLSVIGKQLGAAHQQNRVTVTAQDGDGPENVVFQGVILQAYIDGQDQPHVRFIVTGKPDAGAARKPMPSTTKKGGAQAQSLAQSIASAMGFKFENNGVATTLRNPYLWGTGVSQMRQLAKAAGFEWGIDPGTNVLAVWPKGQSRDGGIPTISPRKSGPGQLIGYPTFSESTVYATAYYDPSMQPFGKFNLESSITAAQGVWRVGQLFLDLEGYVPHGRWQMTIVGQSVGQSPSSGNE